MCRKGSCCAWQSVCKNYFLYKCLVKSAEVSFRGTLALVKHVVCSDVSIHTHMVLVSKVRPTCTHPSADDTLRVIYSLCCVDRRDEASFGFCRGWSWTQRHTSACLKPRRPLHCLTLTEMGWLTRMRFRRPCASEGSMHKYSHTQYRTRAMRRRQE